MRTRYKVLIIVIPLVLLPLYSSGYLSLEEKGMCKISTPKMDPGKTIIGGTISQSIITQSECEKRCQNSNQYDTIATCEFEGNFGTDWVKTSEDFPIKNVFGVK